MVVGGENAGGHRKVREKEMGGEEEEEIEEEGNGWKRGRSLSGGRGGEVGRRDGEEF